MCLPQFYYISDQLSYFFMFIGNMVLTIFEMCSKKSNLFLLHQSQLHRIVIHHNMLKICYKKFTHFIENSRSRVRNKKIYSIITQKGAYAENVSSNSHVKQQAQILSVRFKLQHKKTKEIALRMLPKQIFCQWNSISRDR